MKISSFSPPDRMLMGPGPSDVHHRVLHAMARPTVGHLDPEFSQMMESLKEMLRELFQTRNKVTFPLSGPGSLGMEFCFVNLLESGDKAIVCRNGVFGLRMSENVERCGGNVIPVNDEWTKPVDPEKVKEAIRQNPEAKLVAFVHAETSTGARTDAEAICRIAKEAGMLTVVDVVTSLAGIPVKVDEWQIDAAYSGTQKCLSCTPGISPVTFSEDAVSIVKQRKRKVQNWFLDLQQLLSYWDGSSGRTYHHTAPVNALYGLHESLVMVLEEGLQAVFQRHEKAYLQLKKGLQKLGIEYAVEEEYCLYPLNAVKIPKGIDEAGIRKKLLLEYGIEIGAGLGAFAGKIWRIGLMGNSAREKNVLRLLSALSEVLV
ncbi:MAG: alanine--glyoxylate aminotransferase family protein [Leptospiraceae bacterium]|nr:alanine--glyoxylate aminotransferase family protein [Leptospiraceae bacterium]MCP5499775.1 alanine--glyoxylate aminotransferase family protein [Leptospiraceae bacterium]